MVGYNKAGEYWEIKSRRRNRSSSNRHPGEPSSRGLTDRRGSSSENHTNKNRESYLTEESTVALGNDAGPPEPSSALETSRSTENETGLPLQLAAEPIVENLTGNDGEPKVAEEAGSETPAI